MLKEPKNTKFQLRLTKAESDMLARQASRAKMTKSHYVIYLLEREQKLHGAKESRSKAGYSENAPPVVVYRNADLRALLWQLSKWGNNLNQATRALNTIAARKIVSEATASEVMRTALLRIEHCETAITRNADNVERLQDERHIVMRG